MDKKVLKILKDNNCILEQVDTKVISTGSLLLDKALGIGGLPLGSMVEIFGHESSSKTTMALHTVANAQKDGLRCAFLDVENALDKQYAEKLGVNWDELIFAQPDSGEDLFNVHNELVKNKLVDVVIVDSIAAVKTKAEIDGKSGESFMGKSAQLISQHCRKNSSLSKKNNVLSLYINQTRIKFGVMYGDPTTTPGGDSLKFHSSIRIQVSATTKIKSGDLPIGNKVKFSVKKNKLAPPLKIAETVLFYGEGYNQYYEVIELCQNKNIIDVSGSWINYGGKKWQGKENFKKELESNDKLFNELKNGVLE